MESARRPRRRGAPGAGAVATSGRVAPRRWLGWCRLSGMTTTWPTHKARARWARQHTRYLERQAKLARRAARRSKSTRQEVARA